MYAAVNGRCCIVCGQSVLSVYCRDTSVTQSLASASVLHSLRDQLVNDARPMPGDTIHSQAARFVIESLDTVSNFFYSVQCFFGTFFQYEIYVVYLFGLLLGQASLDQKTCKRVNLCNFEICVILSTNCV